MTLLSKLYSGLHNLKNLCTYSSANMKTNPESSHRSAYTGGFRRSSALMKKMKMKEKVIEKKVHVKSLKIWIHEVVGIDPPSRSTLPDSERVYQIVCRVDGPEEIEVYAFYEKAKGPNPSWFKYTTVPLDGHPLGEGFLNVEVLRFNSKENLTDPGTSDCPSIGAVSRVRIPLPATINDRIERRCELVKFDGFGNLKLEGFIILSMRLEGFTYY